MEKILRRKKHKKMISERIKSKGILAKLLENGFKFLIKRECKEINDLKIDIIATSIQIIKGEIPTVNIIAKNINYKHLLFDKVELESSQIKIDFDIKKKEISFKNIPIINFKILISENSLRGILLSNNWNWIGNMICKEILNQKKLEDLEIKDGQLLIETSKNNIDINKLELINIKTEMGKVYLDNKNHNKTVQLPIEDKIYIRNITIENDLINIVAESSLSF
tara:strand:- start:309 stop:977 length:669 start_codon:yes stop_codon:yes gene_type:complete